MQQKKHFRNELKYAIPHGDYIAMRERIRHVMLTDPHTGPGGTYQIRSIYFDNPYDKALREKVDGIQKREKFRIRSPSSFSLNALSLQLSKYMLRIR